MLQHQPSRTAEYMAMFRASEHAKGAGRRVFTDPLAAALLPGSLRLPAKLLALRPVGEMLNRYIDRQWPGARTSGIARTRLIDDWIGESIGQAKQVVLLVRVLIRGPGGLPRWIPPGFLKWITPQRQR
jgi:O-methyltransferase involved in polyketide biosynthesis